VSLLQLFFSSKKNQKLLRLLTVQMVSTSIHLFNNAALSVLFGVDRIMLLGGYKPNFVRKVVKSPALLILDCRPKFCLKTNERNSDFLEMDIISAHAVNVLFDLLFEVG
jgi:hypothetical protein